MLFSVNIHSCHKSAKKSVILSFATEHILVYAQAERFRSSAIKNIRLHKDPKVRTFSCSDSKI
jgi:hypothetical protein